MNAFINSLPSTRRTASSGFTLVEMMVTIAVLAIIVSIAAPNISTQLANQRVKSTAATLENALKEAKAESVIRRQDIAVSYTNGTADAGTITIGSLKTYRYDAKSQISAIDTDTTAVTTMKFKPSKTADKTTFTICDSNSVASARQIIVTAIGNIKSQVGGTC